MKKNNKKAEPKFSLKSIVAKKGFYIALLTLIMVVGTVSVVRKFTDSVSVGSSSFDDAAWEEAVAEAEEEMSGNSEAIDEVVAQIPELEEMYNEYQEEAESETENTVATAKELSDEEIIAALNMISPCPGSVIKKHSPEKLIYSETMNDWRTHEGIDIAAEEGSVVAAAADGVVEEVYEDDDLGIVVVIGHEGNIKTLYGNLQDLNYIEVGRRVAKGDTIGAIGKSAILEKKDKAHLHFEIIKNEESQNPTEYIPL